ncbi:hypothetical protein [Sphingomonas sp.]|uniref:hypothetical protein n=1 Tax=Sphingomonas sp. TaxID=28214 RepID=UPI003CC57E0A
MVAATLGAGPGATQLSPPVIAGTPRSPATCSTSVIDFGAVGDGMADDGAALRRALAWAASVHGSTGGATPRLHVPPGTYRYAQSPNFAVSNLHLDCSPGTVFRHSDEGPAFLLDGGSIGDGVYRVQVTGNPMIGGNAATSYGLDVRALHHSLITASVRDVAAAALRTRWSVCTEYGVRVTGLAIGGMQPSPIDGFVLDARGEGEDTAACLFRMPIAEQARDVGIRLVHTINCTFLSGTAEGNGQGGLLVERGASDNLFLGMDLEVNGTFGVRCEGDRNSFVNLYDDGIAVFAGTANRVQGSQFNTIHNRGDGNSFEAVSYASTAAGRFHDTGRNTRRTLIRNLTSGILDRDLLCAQGPPIIAPAGGVVQDIEARRTLAAILQQLRTAGVLS